MNYPDYMQSDYSIDRETFIQGFRAIGAFRELQLKLQFAILQELRLNREATERLSGALNRDESALCVEEQAR